MVQSAKGSAHFFQIFLLITDHASMISGGGAAGGLRPREGSRAFRTSFRRCTRHADTQTYRRALSDSHPVCSLSVCQRLRPVVPPQSLPPLRADLRTPGRTESTSIDLQTRTLADTTCYPEFYRHADGQTHSETLVLCLPLIYLLGTLPLAHPCTALVVLFPCFVSLP